MPYSYAPNIEGKATGEINFSRIVKLVAGTDNGFAQSASATSPNVGVAQQGTKSVPTNTNSSSVAAEAGDNIAIYGPGSGVGRVELGGTVAVGDVLTSDSNGRAITTTTEGDCMIGWAMQAGVANDLVAVLIQPGYLAT